MASAGVFDDAAEADVIAGVFRTLAAVVAASSDPTIAERVVVRIMHSVDGGWGIGGHAFTNDEIDEGPEPAQ